jgi:MFS transporter, UMF1 family
MPTASKKVINGWAMYDWANSVYNLVITTTFFPVLYSTIVRAAPYNGKITVFGREFDAVPFKDYCMSLAFLLVVFMIPVLSSIADTRGNKKKFMFFFCLMGSICCSLLFFFSGSNVLLAIFLFCMATIGFYGSQVFYNSYLPEIADIADQDRISAKGYMYGYVGSVILQIIGFGLVLYFGEAEQLLPLQITFLLVGIWWFGFAQITFKRLPPSPPAIAQKGNPFKDGFRELQKVWRHVKNAPVLKRYLIAFFLYSTGVQTIMLAATDFGLTELQLEQSILIITVVIIQLVGVVGALIISRLSGKFGNIRTLIGTVIMWILVCFIGYYLAQRARVLKPYADKIEILKNEKRVLTENDSTAKIRIDTEIKSLKETMKPDQMPIQYGFFILAAMVGLVMGGIQALSRATYSKLMPETKDTASFFSFYDVTEKLSIVVGVFSFGFIHELTGTMSNSIFALVGYFALGLLWLFFTYHKKTGNV